MEEDSTKQGPQSTEEKEMCPMSAMCKGMMGKPWARFLLIVPGAVLVIVGVLILLKPKILFWPMAGTSILIGIIMLVLATFIKKMGARFENVQN